MFHQVDPAIRLKRLYADHAAMVELQHASKRISFQCRGSPPDRYLVTYRCKGTVREGTKVRIAHRHVVEIILHAYYPILAPRFRLRTPLFHPNFRYGGANLQVCIEAANYSAKEPLDDLVLRIGNMITYRNYNPGNPLDAVAARWAVQNQHAFPIDDCTWITPASELVEIVAADGEAPEDEPDIEVEFDDGDEEDDFDDAGVGDDAEPRPAS
jgi:ubiquitin-protein ligase